MEDQKLETGCCPIFQQEPWNEKEFVWKEKKFIKDHVISFLHIPINFGSVMTSNCEKIEHEHQEVKDGLILSDENSLWGSDLYFCVNDDIPDADNVKISGTFYSKVYEGSFSDIGTWTEHFKTHLESKGKRFSKLYYWYTTCPKCAKVYGKNYVVLLGKIED